MNFCTNEPQFASLLAHSEIEEVCNARGGDLWITGQGERGEALEMGEMFHSGVSDSGTIAEIQKLKFREGGEVLEAFIVNGRALEQHEAAEVG